MRPPATVIGPALLLASLAGCVRDPDAITLDRSTPVVFAVLQAGADSAAILLVRDQRLQGEPTPIRDAAVALIHRGDTTWATPDTTRSCTGLRPEARPEGDGCYYAFPGTPIDPGSEYSLDIVLTTGEHITGRATVPSPPTLLGPEDGLRLTARCVSDEYCYSLYVPGSGDGPVATIPVRWQVRADVPPPLVSAVALMSFYGTRIQSNACTLGGSSIWSVGEGALDLPIQGVHCTGSDDFYPARFDSIRAEVRVSIPDPGYSAYLDAMAGGETIRIENASRGLTGAYGCFGAVATARRSFLLVRDPPPASSP